MAAAFFNDLSNKIGSIFGTGDSLPWTDAEMILVSSLFCSVLFCSRSSPFVLWFSLRGVFSLFFWFFGLVCMDFFIFYGIRRVVAERGSGFVDDVTRIWFLPTSLVVELRCGWAGILSWNVFFSLSWHSWSSS